mmetsp:Transcript_29266/g.95374  ORF Transcript_29266/g.95374 Transcript_29266/m.95374 type:complete len:342 (-) Transcript_29266:735-1760(-)
MKPAGSAATAEPSTLSSCRFGSDIGGSSERWLSSKEMLLRDGGSFDGSRVRPPLRTDRISSCASAVRSSGSSKGSHSPITSHRKLGTLSSTAGKPPAKLHPFTKTRSSLSKPASASGSEVTPVRSKWSSLRLAHAAMLSGSPPPLPIGFLLSTSTPRCRQPLHSADGTLPKPLLSRSRTSSFWSFPNSLGIVPSPRPLITITFATPPPTKLTPSNIEFDASNFEGSSSGHTLSLSAEFPSRAASSQSTSLLPVSSIAVCSAPYPFTSSAGPTRPSASESIDAWSSLAHSTPRRPLGSTSKKNSSRLRSPSSSSSASLNSRSAASIASTFFTCIFLTLCRSR